MINNIQLIRAFAALNVVLMHTLFSANSYDLPAQYLSIFDQSEWGNNGVDLFFVVSGFVMVFTQSHRPKSAAQFFKNRIIRLVPIYWALTLLFASIFFLAPAAFRETAVTFEHLLSSLFFVSNVVVGENPVLFVGWTLEYEMLFYSVFALGILLPTSKAKVLFPILLLLSLTVFSEIDLILLEFIFGMVAALIYQRNAHLAYAKTMFVVGVILLAASMLYDLQMHRVFKWGHSGIFHCTCIVLFAADQFTHSQDIGRCLLQHISCSNLHHCAFYKISSIFPLWVSNDVIAILCVISTAVIGTFVHYLVEKPLVSITKKLLSFSHPQAAKGNFHTSQNAKLANFNNPVARLIVGCLTKFISRFGIESRHGH